MIKTQEQLNQKVLELVRSQFPVKNGDYEIDLKKIEIKPPKELGNLKQEHELKIQGKSLVGSLRGQFVLKKNGKVIDETGVHKLLEIPYKSHRGTYIVKGQEKVVANQLRSKPGPYTQIKKPGVVKTQVMFPHFNAPRIEMELDEEKGVFKVTVGGKKNFPGIKFLRYIGASEQEIRNALGNDSLADRVLANENAGGSGTLRDLFNLIVNRGFGNEKFPTNEQVAIKMIQDALVEKAKFDEDGKEVTELNLGYKTESLDKKAVLLTVKKTFDVARGKQKEDDRDDLVFQKVLSGEDIILQQVEKDLDKLVSGAKSVVEKKELSRVVRIFDNFGKSLSAFMTTGSLAENVEQTNPLHLFNSFNKVTMLGEGGMGEGAKRHADRQRNLKRTAINRLDPVHTPESGNIGLINYLAQDAEIKNGTITTKFYKVKNGKASKSESNIVELTPKEEYNSYVAFHDLNVIEDNGTTITFKSDKVPARYKGEITEVDKDKIQYIDRAPQNLFGIAANLIPFGHHNDGNRMLMGANMQTQAVNLVNREEPLVQVAADPHKRKTYEELLGEKAFTVKSPVTGTVTRVENDQIVIRDSNGKEHTVDIYDYFPLNMNNFINNEPTVKVGDKVKQGQLIAEGWSTRNGKLALGVNAKVGYLPFKGYNFEDGVVVSESFAEKAATEEVYVKEVLIKDDHVGGPGSNAKRLLREYINPAKSLDKLDEDGIIKPGSEVEGGDILVARLKKVDVDKMSQGSALLARLTGKEVEYRDASEVIPKTGYTRGKVLRVDVVPSPEGKHLIKILIAQKTPLKLGDKIAGRHGNKGTITKILPDNEMPKTEDGKVLDLLFSPLAVPSRKNLGQLLEVNAGLVAEKKGEPFKVVNFSPQTKEEVLKGLQEIGLPDGKIKVIDPETGKPYDNPVTVGNMYVMKLKHKVDDKIQARSVGTKPPNLTYMEPLKSIGDPAGEKENPQKLGEMEMWGLQAHKAIHNILEATTLKGDGAGDRKQRSSIFRFLTGEKGAETLEGYDGVPESLKILQNSLTAMGLKMTPLQKGKEKTLNETFSEVLLRPMKDEEIIKLIGKDNKIEKPETFRPKSGRPDEAEKGGLFDPNVFGTDPEKKEDRNKWGYIELVHPLPNPILMSVKEYNPYTELTPFTVDELLKIMKENVVVVTNPGDTGLKKDSIINASQAEKFEIEGKTFEYKAGGDAILHYLKKVNVDKELKETEKRLKQATGKDRDKLYKRYRILEALKKNDLKPQDLMTYVVPVAPAFMRPRQQQGKKVFTNDLNKLYSEIIKANNAYASTLGQPEMSLATQLGKDSSHLYKTLSDLYGSTTFIDRGKNRPLKGFKDLIGGKEGLVHERMLAKKVDFSGRSVIGVDPTLKLDEVGIPYDMARELYRPFIIKELVRTGRAKNHDEAERMVKNDDPKIKDVVNRIAKERPIIINRAPTLHKYSIQAFKPIIKDFDDTGRPIRTIQLNPLVTGGFNADFDGDTMAVHVPLTDKAIREAKELMMPSRNLINPKNGEIMLDLKHEMLLGLYYLTMNPEKAKGTPKSFRSYEELKKAWREKKIDTRAKATLNGQTATVGQLLVNFLIPEKHKKHRDFDRVLSKKAVRDLLQALHEDKKVSAIDIANIADDLKELGFEAATKSGLSIGVTDFKKPEDLNKKIDEVIKDIDKHVENKEEALIAGFRMLEEEIEKRLKTGEILPKDNPVQIMMESGARGNAGQVRRMSALVGVGRDVLGNLTLPVTKSHLDGLAPQDYWIHGFDSRKGMYDRVISTADPGELTKRVMAGTQDVLVTEKDCGTDKGVRIRKSNRTIIGRFASQNIADSSGKIIVKKNEMIDRDDFDRINKDNSITEIWVRSPMTCQAVKGVCQKCYGAMPNTTELPKIGDPVGIIATQSLGEPVTQMTMNTFHSGAATATATLGLPRINEILNVSKSPENQAVLAKTSGKVKITEENGQKVVYVDNIKHVIGKGVDGKTKPLRVKDGDYVNKGDFLTLGTVEDMFNPELRDKIMTNANPYELLKYNLNGDDPSEAVRKTQDYLANSMEYAFARTVGDGAIDRRHLEIAVQRLTSKVKVIDPGDSNYLPGQIIERAEAERWNAENASPLSVKEVPATNTKDVIGAISAKTYKDKNGVVVREGEEITRQALGRLMVGGLKKVKIRPRPIKYEAQVTSMQSSVYMGHDNWMSNLGFRDAAKQIARGAAFGQVDKLDSIRSRQMTGNLLNIGEGFNLLQTIKDKANSFKNSLINMFRD